MPKDYIELVRVPGEGWYVKAYRWLASASEYQVCHERGPLKSKPGRAALHSIQLRADLGECDVMVSE